VHPAIRRVCFVETRISLITRIMLLENIATIPKEPGYRHRLTLSSAIRLTICLPSMQAANG
jgi:hypothetical protein